MVLGQYSKALAASAFLAGAFVLLALSPAGEGIRRTGDELVWWALEQAGAVPLRAELEAQFLFRRGAGQSFEALARALGASGAGEPAGADRATGWQVWRRPLVSGEPPGPSPEQGGEQGLLVLRWSEEGRARPQDQERLLAAWSAQGRIYRLYRAQIGAPLEGASLGWRARRLVRLLGGRGVESLSQPGLVVISGYSPFLGPGRREATGRELNFQVALRVNRTEGRTLVFVGVPLLVGSF